MMSEELELVTARLRTSEAAAEDAGSARAMHAELEATKTLDLERITHAQHADDLQSRLKEAAGELERQIHLVHQLEGQVVELKGQVIDLAQGLETLAGRKDVQYTILRCFLFFSRLLI